MRRAQPLLFRDPGWEALPSQGCGGRAGGAHEPLSKLGRFRSWLSSRMITTTHAHKALADKGGDFTGSSAGGHQP